MNLINNSFGYVVVRLPEFVGEAFGDTLRPICGSRGETISYYGLDREPWRDFSDLFYAKQLTGKAEELWHRIKRSRLSDFSQEFCFEIQTAKEILEISNQISILNELIMITALSDISLTTGLTNVLGFDCYVDGYGSLLRLGLFQRVDVFSDFLSCINTNGLFNTPDQLSKYIEAYLERCLESGLEPIYSSQQSNFYIFLVSRITTPPANA